MKILGIETSCDDTAVALLECNAEGFEVIKNTTSSQTEIHKKYGGIVPEIAGRAHADFIIPVLQETLGDNFDKNKPDIIAVTSGPGLVTSLVVGVEVAKGLAMGWDVPVIGVNHIEGHIYSVLLENDLSKSGTKIEFPCVALVVSGGHTELILMRDHGVYELIGKTRDDAAGECFDKVGKLLGFEYPGGPEISKQAAKGDLGKIKLPLPMINSKNFDFSFSGLKTAARYWLEENTFDKDITKNDFCASFEKTIVDVLISKTMRAAKSHNAKSIVLCGGVSANQLLRDTLLQSAQKELNTISVHIPALKYTTDNAAMIALAGYFSGVDKTSGIFAPAKIPTNKKTLQADPSWELV